MLLERKVLLKDLFVSELLFLVLYRIRGWGWQACAINDDELFHIPPCTHLCTQWPVESRQLKQSLALQRPIQGESWRGCSPPFGKFSNLSGYPCQSLFHTKNNIKSYNVRSSQIDHYKKTVAIPLLDSLIIQMQDRFSNKDRHACHLLCVVPSIIVNKAEQLDDGVEGMLFWEKHIPFPKSLGN